MLVGGIVAFYLSAVRVRTVVLADEQPKKEPTHETKKLPEVEKEEDANKDPAKEQSRAQVLADHFKVPLTLITDLRQKKLGWGEISHLLAIAEKSHQSIESILALREKGMGWGEIAKKFDLHLGLINREVHAVKREFKKVEHPKKPEHFGEPADRETKHERAKHPERIRPAEINSERAERQEHFERSNRPERILRDH